MKTVLYLLAALCAASVSLAQEDPGPSPTESVGCVAHGDHWDCEGPRETAAGASSAPAPETTEEHSEEEHGEEHAEGSGVLPPSPTESIGCVAHGDHWDCEGPRETAVGASSAPAPTTTESAEEHDDEDHAEGSGVLPPSPTESVGCVAHGDHWDCEGPATTAAATATTDSTVTSTITSSAVLNATTSADAAPATFTGGAPLAAAGSVGSFGLFALGLLGLAF